MDGQRTNEELLADGKAEQKWRPHGRGSQGRLETMGDQPATSLAFIKERALNWKGLSHCQLKVMRSHLTMKKIATLRRGWDTTANSVFT